MAVSVLGVGAYFQGAQEKGWVSYELYMVYGGVVRYPYELSC